MINETTINNVLAGQECRIYVTLKFAGVAVNTDDFDVYGSATDGLCSPAFSVTTTEKAGQFLVTIPSLSISRSAAYTYQLCARRKSTGHEWVVLYGTIDLTARVTDMKASKINIPEKVIEVTLEPESDLPPEYTPLEYIENIHKNAAYILLPINLNTCSDSLRIETSQVIFWGEGCEELIRNRSFTIIWGCGHPLYGNPPNHYYFSAGTETWSNQSTAGEKISAGYKTFSVTAFNGEFQFYFQGEQVASFSSTDISSFVNRTVIKDVGVFAVSVDGVIHKDLFLLGRKKYFKVWKNDVMIRNLIPCLDETGAPCMFDTVHQVPFYSLGPNDFTFPQQAEPVAVPFSRRRPVTYAQLTEHGVRRLYKVPSGYNGTKEEYAADHGFKPLVETPQPEEGYWAPEWSETEEEIVLDWVEIEPPAELETLNQQ